MPVAAHLARLRLLHHLVTLVAHWARSLGAHARRKPTTVAKKRMVFRLIHYLHSALVMSSDYGYYSGGIEGRTLVTARCTSIWVM